jgi:hypothetical protein
MITIHVCDENRKVNKDFKCAKSLLVSQMKFFELHLSGSGSFEDIDISVHCDVGVFESLMLFLNSGTSEYILEVSNVISILISSEYLQMERLVDDCLQFIVNHINEVVNLSIDMACISPKLMRKLASLIDVQKLDEISDRRDKLLSRIYTNKVEAMMDDETNHLSRCIYCDRLFAESQRSVAVCEKADIFIDFHGNVLAEHLADCNWDFKKFVSYLNSQGLGSREIYWKIWSRLIMFDCVDCGECFQGAELEHCSYHPLEAKFTIGSNIGVYQCCQEQAVRFDTSIKKQGCTAHRHSVCPEQTQSTEYEVLIKKLPTTAEPFLEDSTSALARYVKQFVVTQEVVLCSEDEVSPVTSQYNTDESDCSDEELKARKGKKSKSKVNPAKQRAWKLDLLRLKDFEAMKDLSAKLISRRRRKDVKVRTTKPNVSMVARRRS